MSEVTGVETRQNQQSVKQHDLTNKNTADPDVQEMRAEQRLLSDSVNF